MAIAERFDPRNPQSYLNRTRQIESGGRNNAVSSTGAAGPFQFTLGTARRYGLSPLDRFDYNKSANAALRLAIDNAERLRHGLGRDPTNAEVYLAHQQGPDGAIALLTHPNMPAAQALVAGGAYRDPRAASRAISVNGGTPNMPALAFANKWLNKFGNGSGGNVAAYQTASTTPSGPIPLVNGMIPAGTTPVSTPTGSTTTTTPPSPTPGGAPTPTTPTSGTAPSTPASEPTPTTPSDPGGWEDYIAPVPNAPEYENQVESADDGYQSVPNASWPGLGATSEEGAGGGGGVQMPQTFDNSSETMNALAAAGRQRMAALGDEAQLGDLFANSIGPIGQAGKTSDLGQLLGMANTQQKSQRG